MKLEMPGENSYQAIPYHISPGHLTRHSGLLCVYFGIESLSTHLNRPYYFICARQLFDTGRLCVITDRLETLGNAGAPQKSHDTFSRAGIISARRFECCHRINASPACNRSIRHHNCNANRATVACIRERFSRIYGSAPTGLRYRAGIDPFPVSIAFRSR